jgi:signal transduction histidine kinase
MRDEMEKKNLLLKWRDCQLAFVIFFVFSVLPASRVLAQDKVTIQVKAFDTQLKPYRNIDISINGKDFISLGSKAVAFTELKQADLPVKSIRIRDEALEAASWNYTKGVLEVIVRTKSYRMINIVARDADGKALAGIRISFQGRKPGTYQADSKGEIEIPAALDEKIQAQMFSISGYEVVNLTSSGNVYILTAKIPQPIVTEEKPQEKITAKEYFRDFDLSQLDSIQSLTTFYAVFKNYEISKLSPEVRRRIDAKFNELVKAHQRDTVIHARLPTFIGNISDTSGVSDDVRTLLELARLERKTLQDQRAEFDEKIKLINQKLASGVSNMDPQTRAKLMNDISLLEKLLMENESQFFKNQNDYRNLVNALKEKFFDIEDLENKLSASEEQRLEDQRRFRERLLLISGIGISLGLLVVVLITFGARLRKQKKALEVANAEIRRINENLEEIVSERTKMLEEANRELDTFLYRASHDMRSPVCSIIGLCNIASLLSQGEPKELIQRVVDTTEGMDKLLKKLSIISEINQPTNYTTVELYPMASGIAEQFKQASNGRKIDIQLDAKPHLRMESYPGLVETIVYNLVENAVFFTSLQEDRPVAVGVRIVEQGTSIYIEVQDNGGGIDRTIRHRVYDMFFKGTERSKGHGLGLYIVQKAVQTLEGDIDFVSDASMGTKFTVRLPVVLFQRSVEAPAEQYALNE